MYVTYCSEIGEFIVQDDDGVTLYSHPHYDTCLLWAAVSAHV